MTRALRSRWSATIFGCGRTAARTRLLRAQGDLVGFLTVRTAWAKRADLGQRGIDLAGPTTPLAGSAQLTAAVLAAHPCLGKDGRQSHRCQ